MVNNISFGYRSPIKRIAKHCAYTGEPFSESNPATFEHIVPKSNGGRASLKNCLAVTAEANQARANMPFKRWISTFPGCVKNIQNYLNEMRGTIVNGRDYVEAVKKTLNKQAKGIVVFKGNCQPIRKK